MSAVVLLAENVPEDLLEFFEPISLDAKRSVLWLSNQGFRGCHFATFPPKLVEPMVKAGTSEYGCCARCKTPWVRQVDKQGVTRERANDYVKRNGAAGTGNKCPNTVAGVETTTLGWEPGCVCGEAVGVVPCVVLDPFVGSGTTTAVAVRLGRHALGIDLNEEYLRKYAIMRTEEAVALCRR